jgi:hypothetical protein
MRTVELLCSAPLSTAVRAGWQQLAAAGLPSLATHTHPTNRPHLTLASAAGFAPGTAAALGAALSAVLPLPVRLAGLRLLDGRGTLVWVLAPDPALLAAHRAVWRILDGAAERNPLHRPGRWLPHLSLARRFRPADLDLAREVLTPVTPTSGALVAARSYDSTTRAVTPLGATGGHRPD